MRANAPRLPHRRTAGEALRLAESPHLPGERTPRAHGGARPRTLTRAAHSRRLRPHPCAKQPRAPRTPQGPHPVHQTPASCPGAQGPARRGPGPLGADPPPIPEARPPRVPQHRADTARPAPTRGREEGAVPRLGLAPGLGDWGTPQPTRPSPPPPPPPFSAAQKVAGGTAVPVQPTGGPRLRHLRCNWAAEPETRAGEAQGCGAEIRAEAARRASRVPSPLPPRSAPATARRRPRLLLLLPRPPSRPPPSSCGGAARQRWARLLRPAPTPRARAGGREKGFKRPEVAGGGGGVAAWGGEEES